MEAESGPIGGCNMRNILIGLLILLALSLVLLEVLASRLPM